MIQFPEIILTFIQFYSKILKLNNTNANSLYETTDLSIVAHRCMDHTVDLLELEVNNMQQ